MRQGIWMRVLLCGLTGGLSSSRTGSGTGGVASACVVHGLLLPKRAGTGVTGQLRTSGTTAKQARVSPSVVVSWACTRDLATVP